MKVLLKTVHGSHLYGLAHAGSDMDMFTVFSNFRTIYGGRANGYIRQTIDGDNDDLICDLSSFMDKANQGVPQFVEAMYSRQPSVDVLGESYRLNFRPNVAQATRHYMSASKALFAQGLENNDIKRIRHGIRLRYNLTQIQRGIVFNPEVTEEAINEMADQFGTKIFKIFDVSSF